MNRVFFAAAVLGAACGIKGPPKPPLPILYEARPAALQADSVVLRFVARGALPAGRVAVEEHEIHGGVEGLRCGWRRVVALVAARAEIVARVPRRAVRVRYRLRAQDGAPLSDGVDVPAPGG
jgi:hypothetical protein